jgi:hypothetical protein
MGMNRIFRCFRIIQVSTGFRAVSILASNSLRYSWSKIDSPYLWVGEPAIEFLKEVQVVPEEPEKWKAADSTICIIQVSIGPLH